MAGSSEEPESPDGGEEKRIKTGRRRRPVVGSPFNWLYTPSTWFLVIQPLAGTAHIYLTVKSTLNYLSKALVSKINVMMYGTLLASIHMSRTQSSHVDQRTTWIYQCRNQSFSLHVQIKAAILEGETLKLFLSNKRHFTLALEGLRLTISIFCAWSRTWRHFKFALHLTLRVWGIDQGNLNGWNIHMAFFMAASGYCFQVHRISHQANIKRLFSHKTKGNGNQLNCYICY